MMIVSKEISKTFNQHALEYERAAVVQHEVGMRVFDRLQYLNIKPKRILDLGCGPGYFSSLLKKKYPHAELIGLDLAQGMLIQARKKQTWRRQWALVAGEMNSLPFADGQFDLIFANQVIHWSNALNAVFSELHRVMAVNACLMFTTLGPDTFKELKQAWAPVNDFAHTNDFADMHDVGDGLLAEHFIDPVMDMEHLSIHYSSLMDLVHSLKNQGVKNINIKRNHGLTSRASWTNFEQNYAHLCTENGKYPLTYEVIYGHAWKGEPKVTVDNTETRISLSHIKKAR